MDVCEKMHSKYLSNRKISRKVGVRERGVRDLRTTFKEFSLKTGIECSQTVLSSTSRVYIKLIAIDWWTSKAFQDEHLKISTGLACLHTRMPRAHQAGSSSRSLAGAGFFKSAQSHGPGTVLMIPKLEVRSFLNYFEIPAEVIHNLGYEWFASKGKAGGIIGLYFFKNDEGHNVTVNGDRYRAMITNLFIPELNNHDVQELWFQQDGATCHTARATIDLLKDTFGDPLISRFGPVNWPPRSCDLTPLDYFLWGYVKSLVYVDKPQTLDHLEDNIRRIIADIRPQMLEKVIENWTSRLDCIGASRGSPMPEIIFKM
ncbi:transposable element Tc3 transposase [Trichonephila clavipes]|nr:transposable element Tc3 transposase [Trichonephila clavipes]